MSKLKRVDSNQKKIVQTLRAIGADVLHLHEVGKGCPDILVGFRNQNFLFEIKDSSLPPSRRKLTEAEQEFHDSWRGQVAIITCADEALQIIGAVSHKGWKDKHGR